MESNRNTKRIFDIQPLRKSPRQGLVVDLRKVKVIDKVDLPVKEQPTVSREPYSDDSDRDQILRELIKLEIQEENRQSELDKNVLVEELVIPTLPEKEKASLRIRIRGVGVFVILSVMFSLIIPLFLFYQKAQALKGDVFSLTGGAIRHIKLAGQYIADSNFEDSAAEFSSAQIKFSEGAEKLESLGASMFRIFNNVPGVSLVTAAEQILRAGEYLAQAAQELNAVANYFVNTDFDIYSDEGVKSKNSTLIDTIIVSRDRLSVAREKINAAKLELELINKKGLKADFKEQVEKLEQVLDQVRIRLDKSDQYADALLKILGNDYPKLYLFIFQNNQEMRATGGFIGTYGLFKINNGHIEKVVVDGIYNPDGQLKEKVVPPFPLWKISPNWGLRDANWFADFPTSAKKIVWFYEKTGGPTVDGVMSFTPTVMEKLLDIIGPIEMPDYGVTVNSENFVEITQKEVELDYDKEKNQPKQFLTDLTPIVLERIFNAPKDKLPEIAKVFGQNLKERHIMLYFLNEEVENLILEEKIGGALKDAPKDYLSVVNSNIDGRKTDGIIENDIHHEARVQEDGSIIDTVTIKRTHKGGQEAYDWWNAENKNFLRIYTPLGSELLEARGFSKEVPAPLLGIDYSQYKKDELWSAVEQTLRQDDKSGTWVFEETGKTVFGNWVYTGPGKTSEVSFTYKLPFKINEGQVGNYSLLIQKQAGAVGDILRSDLITRPSDVIAWQYPELQREGERLSMESVLDVDKFYGVVFEK